MVATRNTVRSTQIGVSGWKFVRKRDFTVGAHIQEQPHPPFLPDGKGPLQCRLDLGNKPGVVPFAMGHDRVRILTAQPASMHATSNDVGSGQADLQALE